MKKLSAWVLFCLLPLLTALGQEKNVSQRELPPAVVQSLERNFQNYTIGQVVRLSGGAGSGFRIRIRRSDGTGRCLPERVDLRQPKAPLLSRRSK